MMARGRLATAAAFLLAVALDRNDQRQGAARAGTAILTGDVATAAERSSAGQNAFEGGALRVRNRLTVRGRGRFPY